ncbi:MAG: hypothetical protein OXI57_03775 [Rhodospirillales bacterium]|nr:hypothetical protein [Rhodospirillales bacterium]
MLDLRANTGGDFDRMRRVASLFTGPRLGAIRLHGREGVSEVPGEPLAQDLVPDIEAMPPAGP